MKVLFYYVTVKYKLMCFSQGASWEHVFSVAVVVNKVTCIGVHYSAFLNSCMS